MPASKQTRVEPELDEHGRPYDFFTNPSPRHMELLRQRAQQNDADLAAGLGMPWDQALEEAFGPLTEG